MITETILDIIFCIAVMPGMMFLFPTAEWLLWHPGHVLLYVVWLYAVWFLCRKILAPAAMQGWKGLATVIGTLFLVAAVTFLMSLSPVEFPRSAEDIGKIQPHVRAMWVLLLADISYSITVGILSSRIRELSMERAKAEEAQRAKAAVETRRQAVASVSGDEIVVKSDYKKVHVPISAILYVEGRNNYVCIHVENHDDVVSQTTLKSIMEMLPEGKFVRIHRSFIVPQWRIVSHNGTGVTLLGVAETLPVGRAFKEQLNKADEK